MVRAKRGKHLPIVPTRDEVRAVNGDSVRYAPAHGHPPQCSGLRLLECCRLRVQDVDFGMNQIVVGDGKGAKDRVIVPPAAVKGVLTQHLQRVKRQHEADLTRGAGCVELTWAFAGKYPDADCAWHGNGCSGPPVLRRSRPPATAAAVIRTRRCCSAP